MFILTVDDEFLISEYLLLEGGGHEVIATFDADEATGANCPVTAFLSRSRMGRPKSFPRCITSNRPSDCYGGRPAPVISGSAAGATAAAAVQWRRRVLQDARNVLRVERGTRKSRQKFCPAGAIKPVE
jgi:hypothetical protein